MMTHIPHFLAPVHHTIIRCNRQICNNAVTGKISIFPTDVTTDPSCGSTVKHFGRNSRRKRSSVTTRWQWYHQAALVPSGSIGTIRQQWYHQAAVVPPGGNGTTRQHWYDQMSMVPPTVHQAGNGTIAT